MTDSDDEALLHIRFERNDDGYQPHAYASEFCAFWRDPFGIVHFVAVPDDGRWNEYLDRPIERAGDAG